MIDNKIKHLFDFFSSVIIMVNLKKCHLKYWKCIELLSQSNINNIRGTCRHFLFLFLFIFRIYIELQNSLRFLNTWRGLVQIKDAVMTITTNRF